MGCVTAADWVSHRQAKIEAAKKLRDDKRDGITEEHTFQPKRIARRSESASLVPAAAPEVASPISTCGASDPRAERQMTPSRQRVLASPAGGDSRAERQMTPSRQCLAPSPTGAKTIQTRHLSQGMPCRSGTPDKTSARATVSSRLSSRQASPCRAVHACGSVGSLAAFGAVSKTPVSTTANSPSIAVRQDPLAEKSSVASVMSAFEDMLSIPPAATLCDVEPALIRCGAALEINGIDVDICATSAESLRSPIDTMPETDRLTDECTDAELKPDDTYATFYASLPGISKLLCANSDRTWRTGSPHQCPQEFTCVSSASRLFQQAARQSRAQVLKPKIGQRIPMLSGHLQRRSKCIFSDIDATFEDNQVIELPSCSLTSYEGMNEVGEGWQED